MTKPIKAVKAWRGPLQFQHYRGMHGTFFTIQVNLDQDEVDKLEGEPCIVEIRPIKARRVK